MGQFVSPAVSVSGEPCRLVFSAFEAEDLEDHHGGNVIDELVDIFG